MSAASLLERAGHHDVGVLDGGPPDWVHAADRREPLHAGRMSGRRPPARPVRLGLRANLAQFTPAGRGQRPGRRHARPGTHRAAAAGASRRSPSAAYTGGLTFILAFGVAKAATNYFAGTLSDRYGRKPVLVAGLARRAVRSRCC